MPDQISTSRPDVGLSHVALVVADLAASVEFYGRYGGLDAVHRRGEPGRGVAWLSDGTRPFVIVLVENEQVEVRLTGTTHLGVGCASRGEVDRLAALAKRNGCLLAGPTDNGAPVGYMALLQDPDGHNLELSYGQQISQAIAAAPQPSACAGRSRDS